MPEPDRDALSKAFSRLAGITANTTGQTVANSFKDLGSWREEDIDRFIELVGPTVTDSKTRMANYVISYYQRIAGVDGHKLKNVSVKATELTTEALRNGTLERSLWQRPFKEVWLSLSKGKDLDTAVADGARRAHNIATTEIQLAKRQAGLSVRKGNKNIVGYLRLLTGAENCGLCYLASTQRYHHGDLLPIHPGCDCGETPIFGNTDVGQIIDQQTLDATHEAVSQRFGEFDASGRQIDYRKIQIQNHTELGPYLSVEGHQFTKVKPEKLNLDVKPPSGKPIVRAPFADRLREDIKKFDVNQARQEIYDEFVKTPMPTKNKRSGILAGPLAVKHVDAVVEIGRKAHVEIVSRVEAELNLLSKDAVALAENAKEIAVAQKLLDETNVAIEAAREATRARREAEWFLNDKKYFEGQVARGELTAAELPQWLAKSKEDAIRRSLIDLDAYTRIENKALFTKQKTLTELLDNLKAVSDPKPLTKLWEQTYAKKAAEVLAEVRQVGGAGPSFVGNATSNALLEQARNVYPTDWLLKAKDKFKVVTTQQSNRGFWRGTANPVISISGREGAYGFEAGHATAVHEMGHMFEDSVPGIVELEWAFLKKRVAEAPGTKSLGRGETAFPDTFRSLYTGRHYGDRPTGSNFEIFTTGVESVFSGSTSFDNNLDPKWEHYRNPATKDLGTDEEFRNFVLGVLFTL